MELCYSSANDIMGLILNIFNKPDSFLQEKNDSKKFY